jgi:hypothetical protein
MTDAALHSVLSRLDSSDQAERDAAWGEVGRHGAAADAHLIEYFGRARKWQTRAAILHHLVGRARQDERVRELGRKALNDRSRVVRYRACAIAAYALRPDAVPALQALFNHPDRQTAEDARAACDAIAHQNHHYYVDRHHTGQMFWAVGEQEAVDIVATPSARSWWWRVVRDAIAPLLCNPRWLSDR